MTIAKRLSILLAVPLLALLGLGVFNRVELSKIEERSRFVAESQVPSIATIGDMSQNFAELRVNVRSYLLATNQADRAKAASASSPAAARAMSRLSSATSAPAWSTPWPSARFFPRPPPRASSMRSAPPTTALAWPACTATMPATT